MDSSIATDPRFKLVAADLGVSWREVVGSAFLVWLTCYERRSPYAKANEIDIAAELPGFTESLVRNGLADAEDDGTVFVHGVIARIKFLERQKKLGTRGGKSSASSRESKRSLDSEKTGPQAYPPAPAPALTPDLDLAPAPAQQPRALDLHSGKLKLPDFIAAIADAGIATHLGRVDQERFAKLYPVDQSELDHALEQADRASAKRPGYVLTVIEEERKKAADLPDQPGARQRLSPKGETLRRGHAVLMQSQGMPSIWDDPEKPTGENR